MVLPQLFVEPYMPVSTMICTFRYGERRMIRMEIAGG